VPDRTVRFSIAVAVAAAFAVAAVAQPAVAQQTPADAIHEQLRISLAEGIAHVQDAHGLDAAYELLGVTDVAMRANEPDIASRAAEALIGTVDRALAASAQASAGEAQDTLDQLLDLKFSASASGIDNVLTTIDRAMKTLIPQIGSERRMRVDTDEDWESRVQSLAALADLQSTAAQATLTDEAAGVGLIFDSAWDQLKATADGESDPGAKMARLDILDAVRLTREERLADALANNVRAVAEEMRASGDDRNSFADDGGTDFALGFGPETSGVEESTCVETGTLATEISTTPASPLDALQRDCAMSGRAPSAARCSTRELSFVCYEALGASESIIYVYRNSPEEEELRRSCGAENLLEPANVPGDGVAFRNSQMKLSLTCAPVGERAAAN
jgi:hypothetical protein